MTPEGLFELTIIFFRLINSLATFQTIVNKILQDLINIRKVASFIDDIIVVIEKKEHNKMVKKIMKRLAENNLYVKPENLSGRLKRQIS